MDFDALASRCAPYVAVATTRALVRTESGFDPWAIHVHGATLAHRPRSRPEALATAKALRAGGWDFDVGLAQINVRNLTRLHVELAQAFDPCTNLRAMQRILQECFARARHGERREQEALREALSCYNTGNFVDGLRDGYVERVVDAAGR